MTTYLVHKPVDLAKVKKARRAVLSQPGYLEDNYIPLLKYDGCCLIASIYTATQEVLLYSRTGEAVRSMDHIKAPLLKAFSWAGLTGEWVLYAEAWAEGLDFATISGKFRQHGPAPELGIKAWDLVMMDEWQKGECSLDFYSRLSQLRSTLPPHQVAEVVESDDFEQTAREWVAKGGYDGLIAADPAGTWCRGNGSGGEKIKIKPSVSFDLEVVGTEPGKGKHAGRIGNLVVRYKDGKLLGVGTGLSDADRSRGDWIGKIVEVGAMGFSNDGSLREPRLKGVRHDKEQADY